MPALAERLNRVSISASVIMTIKARELAAQGIKVISLASGEPDFPTPPHAIEAAHQAALAGETKYPPQDGTKRLKEAVQRKFKRDNNLDYALDEIMVTNGGKQSIFNAFMATIDPGDEVLIPAPFWISYAEMAKVAGGVPVTINCPQNNGFKLRPEDLDAAITPKTKWVMINFPNNPTGAACSRDEMKAIAAVLMKHPHVWIMTDDMYEHLIYDGFEFCTIADVEPRLKDRTLTVNGVSERSMLQRVPLIMVIFPARHGVAIGISATSFLDRTFATTTTGRAVIDGKSVPTSDQTEVRGAINDLRAGAGWQISPRFRVGVAGHLYTGENKATRERTFADTLAFGNVLDSSRVTYFGTALSVGGEVTLGKGFTALTSYRRGNELNARIRDTIVAKASVPTRTGVALRYDGIVGSVFAVGMEQIAWSEMASLGSSSTTSTDAMNWHAGAEVAGPKFRGLPLLVRAGYALNELPFGVLGQIAKENRMTAGLGLPVAGEDASLDLSVQRAHRTLSGSGLTETAWLLGIGIQIRPRN